MERYKIYQYIARRSVNYWKANKWRRFISPSFMQKMTKAEIVLCILFVVLVIAFIACGIALMVLLSKGVIGCLVFSICLGN